MRKLIRTRLLSRWSGPTFADTDEPDPAEGAPPPDPVPGDPVPPVNTFQRTLVFNI